MGTRAKITAAALLCRVFDFVHMQEHTCVLLSSGKIHKISIHVIWSPRNQPKQKSGRAIALPAPPPPRSLFSGHVWVCLLKVLKVPIIVPCSNNFGSSNFVIGRLLFVLVFHVGLFVFVSLSKSQNCVKRFVPKHCDNYAI